MVIKYLLMISLIAASINLISCRRMPDDHGNSLKNEAGENIFHETTNEATTDELLVGDNMTFHLTDFEWALKDFGYEYNVDPIDDKEDAVEKAIELWKIRFGEDIDGLYDMIIQHPFHVAFDEANDCWLINGTVGEIDQYVLGAVPQALIKTDGTVLAVWIG